MIDTDYTGRYTVTQTTIKIVVVMIIW